MTVKETVTGMPALLNVYAAASLLLPLRTYECFSRWLDFLLPAQAEHHKHAQRWHNQRILTYLSPVCCMLGNAFLSRHVNRQYNPWTGAATISDVDEQWAVQAGAGDLLFLKGNLCQGMAGELAVSARRLVSDKTCWVLCNCVKTRFVRCGNLLFLKGNLC
jgi:hypothetical protein